MHLPVLLVVLTLLLVLLQARLEPHGDQVAEGLQLLMQHVYSPHGHLHVFFVRGHGLQVVQVPIGHHFQLTSFAHPKL